MSWQMIAMGAAVAFVIGSGCTTQTDVIGVSAMVRTETPRTQMDPMNVSVDLGDIIKP